MTATEQIVLLVLDAQFAETLRVILANHPHGADVRLVAMEGAVASAVATTRTEHGGLPLGMLLRNEADALEAIHADADEALAVSSVDERVLDLLLERTSARARLRLAHMSAHGDAAHADKLAALGTVVAGIAHEINNPLFTVLMQLEVVRHEIEPLIKLYEEIRRRARLNRAILPHDLVMLERLGRTGAPEESLRGVLDDMESAIARAAEIVKDLRIYARADDDDALEIVNMPGLIEQVTRIVEPQIRGMGHIERDYEPELPLLALPRSKVVQVLTNLLVNAVQAIGEIERAVHRVRITARTDGEFVALSISDTGPGIAADLVERIFDPFFTTKETGKGTGLGLSISRSILRRLGGDLLAESVHGQGATFIALLPLPEDGALEKIAKGAKKKRRNEPAPKADRPIVLVVEDDDRLLRAYPRALHEHYDVIVAADGQEAIDLLTSGSNADLVLTDLSMPEVDGQQLFEWLGRNRPDLAKRTIFVTAGARSEGASDFLESIDDNMVLEKPVSREQLLDALERVLR